MQLQDMSWPDVDQAEPNTVVFPIGSTEQHGPHAPVGTDSYISTEMAQAAAERMDIICLPPLQVGLAEHHRNFPGTLYVSGETFRSFVYEVVRGLQNHGIENCILVNGHGGNSAALEEVCGRVSRETDLLAVMWEWMATRDAPVDHGGQAETSLMMYFNEDVVDEPVEGSAKSWGKHIHSAAVAHDTEEFSENGATGDARGASAVKGKELFEESVDELVGLIDWTM